MTQGSRDATGVPAALETLAGVLPEFALVDLESQLQTFDAFLPGLPAAGRARIAALLRAAASRASGAAAARISDAARSVAGGGRAAAPYDHEAAMRAYRAAHRATYGLPPEREDDFPLLARIEEALGEIEPMETAGWPPAASVARQLRWCRDYVLAKPVEEPPGPFSMGLIATRAFDMWGDKPELAALINEIERRIEARRAGPA